MLATFAIFGVTSAGRAEGPASGEVTGVSVQPSPGRADVIINVRGAVEVRDFMLDRPNRLVLDVVGARLKGNSGNLYDGVKRGGVLNVRYSQFQHDVVRIVMELDGAKDYHLERVADMVAVPMREHDLRDALHGGSLVGHERRIAGEEGINQHRVAGKVEAKGGMAEPGDLHDACSIADVSGPENSRHIA